MLASLFLSQVMLIELHRSEDLFTILEAALAVAPIIDDPYEQPAQEDGCAAMPITNLWATGIPKLQRLLATEPTKKAWEEEVERLTDKTFKTKQTEEWAMQVILECLELLQAYQAHSSMLRSALIIVGIGCSQTVRRDLVASSVEAVIDVTNHEDPEHIVGLPKCLGYVARKHLDTALGALRRLAKGLEKRGFFASCDKTKKELTEGSRSIAALGFGYACKNMESAALPSRLDTVVFLVLLAIAREGHTEGNRMAVFEGCFLIGAAVAQYDNYLFKCRDEFLLLLLRVMQPSAKGTSADWLRFSAFATLQSLVGCTPQPPLGDLITRALIDCVVRAVRSTVDVSTDRDVDTINLLSEVLRHHQYLNAMPVLERLVPLAVLEKGDARCLAVKLILATLDGCRVQLAACTARSPEWVGAFVSVGNIIGRLVPRIIDSCRDLRVEAVKGVIAGVLIAHASTETMAQMGDNGQEALLALGQRAFVFNGDRTLGAEKEVISIFKTLCTILVEQLQRREHVTSLSRALLFTGMLDAQGYAAVGACVTMHGLIRGHGKVLGATDVREVLDGLIEALKNDSLSDQVRSGALTSVRNLTLHHVVSCFDSLIYTPVPHSTAVMSCFEAIANDISLCELLIQHILDTVLNSPMTDAASAHGNSLAASSKVLSAVCGAGWIAQTERGSSICRGHRASLYMAIVLFLTACRSVNDDSATVLCGTALKYVIINTVEDVTIVRFDRYEWNNFVVEESYLTAIGEAVCYWCRDGLGDSIDIDRGKIADAERRFAMEPSSPSPLAYELARFMLPYCGHVSVAHRKAAVCVCGELISFVLRDEELIRALIMALL
ncbi:putative HEAT repeat-containing protein 7A [Trypanosoma grayi]|uniref:putative HEAT repeat-containing protein 7A n=1 Tax=Trypanosoma grayi TaxID=71804 RepID=UPI0004F44440|nr:putative HEAT repeat-containing protein 7A [Trypanosoma grayi]KEG14034.1 putative HEAT repeat-containing protein 7A [Trypanosoma grayi]